MAVTRETLRLMAGIRIRIADNVDAATDDLIRAWARAWKVVEADWESAVAELQQIGDDGGWPSRTQILRAERTQRALESTYAGLNTLSDNAGVTITKAINDVTRAAEGHSDVIASQLPTTPTALTMRASLVRADPHQIAAIVTRSTEQVSKLLTPLAGNAYDQMVNSLVRGVAEGLNPRKTARLMLRNLEVGHAFGLNNALVIARTETLDAHRAGAKYVQDSNADVLQGWQWISALDRRTCPSCFAQHGTMHELKEPGPEDHQQGRCTRLPITKTWADLGFTGIDEPTSLVPDAQATFDKLPAGAQLQVMGAKRLKLLDDGDIDWSDLSTKRTNPGWRDSHVVTPLRDLVTQS